MKLDLTLKQIRAFVAVARLGSVTRAAQHLHVTQSAISLLIRDLEANSGVSLFDRGRVLTPTLAGAEFLRSAERVLADVELAVQTLEGLASRERGTVTLAAGFLFASTVLPSVIKQFYQKYPGISVKVLDISSADFSVAVLQGDVDFAVGTDASVNPSTLNVSVLRQNELGVYFPSGHPLARLQRIEWGDLQGYPLIAVNVLNTIWQQAIGVLNERDIYLQVAFEVRNPATALRLVEEELGLAIQPTYGQRELADGKILVKVLEEPRIGSNLALITRYGSTLSSAAQNFIDLLRSSFGEGDENFDQQSNRASR